MAYAAIGLVLILAVWIPLRFQQERKGNKAVSLVFKAAGTLTATAFAAWAVWVGAPGQPYAQWMLAGLLLCTCADVLLAIRTEAGGAFFLLGHMAYGVALWGVMPPGLGSLGVLAASWGILLWYVEKYRSRLHPRLFSGIRVYALALSVLLALSLPLPFRAFRPQTLLAALGAVLFAASDMLLLRNRVDKRTGFARYLSLGMYYAGQMALALSAASLY